MTPRERWLALLAGEKPDRIPTDYWATDEVTYKLLVDMRCGSIEELYTRLNIDGITKIEPPVLRDGHPDDPLADIWGLRRRNVSYSGGSYDEFDNRPLAGAKSPEDVQAYPWPDPDNIDWETYHQQVRHAPRHRILSSGDYEPFLLYCALRGMEQAFMDVVEEPEILEAGLQAIFEYSYRLNERAFEAGQGRIDITYVAEDLGSQAGLLMGLPQIKKFLLPNQKRIADLARSFGIHIFYHSDGAIRSVIPDLLTTTGIEILNPIQWRCQGMEREGLVRDFGDRLIFHGAMDNQQTLPFGTVEEVREEVLENIGIFRSARWICAPCHNIQPVTPTENILALYDTIHREGRL